jgi:hypothetical protein
MMITRKNANGGKPLTKCPLQEENGVLGYKIGYCGGCNEPILVRTIDARDILAMLWIGEDDVKNLLKKLRPKIKLREWLIRRLGGYVASSQLAVDM